MPPAVGPSLGVMPLILGAGVTYANPDTNVLSRPSGLVTMTSTVPAGAAGTVPFSSVEDTNVTFVNGCVPNVTATPSFRLLPTMRSCCPPSIEQVAGVTEVSCGGAM